MALDYIEMVVRNSTIVTAEPTSKRIWNVFHWKRTAGAFAISQVTLMNDAWASFGTPYGNALSENTSIDAADMRYVDDATNAYTTMTIAGLGQVAGDSLPSVNAAVGLFGCGVRGRSAHGRKFFGLIAESDTLQDRLITGAITRFNAVMTAYLNGFTDTAGNTWKPFLLSRLQSKLKKNPTTIVGNVILTAQIETILGRLKRRQEPKR